VAAGVFSHALPLAERYARLLATEGVVRGLIGPREAPRLWERHLLNCALLGQAVPTGAEVCDIGTGAGLPGIVLALSRPDLSLTLVEPLLRRTTFLEEAVDELGLTNVEVVRARAEGLHGGRDFDVVTSRAVAPLDRLLAWSMPLVRQGGHLVAMKGSSVGEEVEAARPALAKYGAGTVEILQYGDGLVDPPTTVLKVEATRPSGLGSAGSRPPQRTKRTSRRKGR
jgi:16S rRNA (guanine527-N7)-methyltransferase